MPSIAPNELERMRSKARAVCATCDEIVVPAIVEHALARGQMVKRGKIVKSWK